MTGFCMRCVTPAKCETYGCCPGTWPASTSTTLEGPVIAEFEAMNPPVFGIVSIHEEGRQAGLHQAVIHIRGEVKRMNERQRKAGWSGALQSQILYLRRLARTIETLK